MLNCQSSFCKHSLFGNISVTIDTTKKTIVKQRKAEVNNHSRGVSISTVSFPYRHCFHCFNRWFLTSVSNAEIEVKNKSDCLVRPNQLDFSIYRSTTIMTHLRIHE